MITITLIRVPGFWFLREAAPLPRLQKKVGCINNPRQVSALIGSCVADHNGNWPFYLQVRSDGTVLDFGTDSDSRNRYQGHVISTMGTLSPYFRSPLLPDLPDTATPDSGRAFPLWGVRRLPSSPFAKRLGQAGLPPGKRLQSFWTVLVRDAVSRLHPDGGPVYVQPIHSGIPLDAPENFRHNRKKLSRNALIALPAPWRPGTLPGDVFKWAILERFCNGLRCPLLLRAPLGCRNAGCLRRSHPRHHPG